MYICAIYEGWLNTEWSQCYHNGSSKVELEVQYVLHIYLSKQEFDVAWEGAFCLYLEKKALGLESSRVNQLHCIDIYDKGNLFFVIWTTFN